MMKSGWSWIAGVTMICAAGLMSGLLVPRAIADAGNCVQFSAGSSSYIVVPSSAALNITNALTIEAWVKPAAGGGEWALVFGKQYNPAE